MQTIKLKSYETVPQNYTGIVERFNGSKYWYLNDIFHREDGPAIELANGTKHWYLNGDLHRVDGPAVEDADGYKAWHLNGQCHREDGPAVEWDDGTKQWWLNGEFILELYSKDQPFLILEETEDQVKILTAIETKWIKKVPGLKQLENDPCKQ